MSERTERKPWTERASFEASAVFGVMAGLEFDDIPGALDYLFARYAVSSGDAYWVEHQMRPDADRWLYRWRKFPGRGWYSNANASKSLMVGTGPAMKGSKSISFLLLGSPDTTIATIGAGWPGL